MMENKTQIIIEWQIHEEAKATKCVLFWHGYQNMINKIQDVFMT